MSEEVGWLLDLYPMGDKEISLCILGEDGEFYLLKDYLEPEIFVNGSQKDLKKLASNLNEFDSLQGIDFVERKVKPGKENETRVLKLSLKSRKVLSKIAYEVLERGEYRYYSIFDVVVSQAQKYMLKNNIFPMAKVRISDFFDLDFELLDSPWDLNYELPSLEILKLSVFSDGNEKFSDFRSPIDKIILSSDWEDIVISNGSESRKLLRLVEELKKIDPDVLITEGGDSWDIPYIVNRAEFNDVSDRLILGRESIPFSESKNEGVSYSSYGRTYYKAPSHYFRGRIHIDTQNSFIYDKCGLDGLIELSRVTRTPLQETARSSIGSIMTNLQISKARKEGVLIPWKKNIPEKFKSAKKLLKADKGGFIYEPELGFHENVGEIDFSSFYPTLMREYNLSPETLFCDCCSSKDSVVPDLGYEICEKKKGIIPKVLGPVLEKRRNYKDLMEESEESDFEIYKNRQNSLKWILVTCFGYLGYRNSKFGRIEAHESVTAFARKKLKGASRVAESEGFEIIHGIVDSLWVANGDINRRDLGRLCEKIEENIEVPIGIEEIYDWIVFPHSKENSQIPVMNRYYGKKDNGEVEAKGLMSKRSDVSGIVKDTQVDMLKVLSESGDKLEFEQKIGDALDLLKGKIEDLRKNDVSFDDLIIKKRLSRSPEDYEGNVRSAIASKQLEREGVELHAGQQVEYIVKNSESENPRNRVIAARLADGERFDKDWYIDRLISASYEMLNPFVSDKRVIKNRIDGSKQETLEKLP